MERSGNVLTAVAVEQPSEAPQYMDLSKIRARKSADRNAPNHSELNPHRQCELGLEVAGLLRLLLL